MASMVASRPKKGASPATAKPATATVIEGTATEVTAKVIEKAKEAASVSAATSAPTNQSTAVATRPRGQDDSVPDFMRSDAGQGMGNISSEDLEIPRLKLMQGTSPEVKEYDALKPGHLFHTGALENFPDGVSVVPLYVDKRYMLWRPLENGGGVLARADDGTNWTPANRTFEVQLDKKDGGHKVVWKTADTVEASGLAEWGSSNPNDPDSQPAAVLMYCFVVMFPDHPEMMPAVLTFQRTSIKAGRKWLTALKNKRAPIFGQRFRLNVVEDRNESNQEFYNLSVSGEGFVSDRGDYEHYKELAEQFGKSGIQIKDLEGVEREARSPAADDGDGEGQRAF